MSLDRLLNDHRLVTIEHCGEKMHFAYSRRATQIAKDNHGYDEEASAKEAESAPNDAQAYIDNVLRLLWMCHLPFEPEMAFEEFSSLFFPVDYGKLGQAWNDVLRKQIGFTGEDDEEEEKPKKAKGRAKGK